MAEGFWNWGPMPTLQAWVDATRAWVDPVMALSVAVLLALLAVALFSRPPSTTRDHGPPGTHFLGRLDPKNLARMLLPPRRKPRSRSEMEAAIRMGARKRRRAEAAEDDGDRTVDREDG